MVRSAFGWPWSVCIAVVLMGSGAFAGVLGARSNRINLNFTAVIPELQRVIPALVVFGDSTVDAGNNNYLPTIVKSNFQPYGSKFDGGQPTGRFTDGLLATDTMSLSLGIPFQLPFLSPKAYGEAILTGVNFATSGSGWFEGTDEIWNVKGIGAQLQWYQNWKAEVLKLAGSQKGNYIIANALNVISTGTNDWVNNYYLNSSLRGQFTPDQYTTMLLGLVRKHVQERMFSLMWQCINTQELYTLGGRNIVILDLLPLGCLPEQISLNLQIQGCVQSENKNAIDFNNRFRDLMEDMKKTMPGSRLISFDIYPVFDNAIQNPQKYGFKYTRTGCCGTGAIEVSFLCNRAVPTCSNPDEHIFWDSFHPTSHFYSHLVDELLLYAKPILLATPNP